MKNCKIFTLRAVRFALGLTLAILFVLYGSTSAQPPKIRRIGFLSPYTAQSDLRLEAFRQGLRDLGYIEGQNIAIEYRGADGNFERLPSLAAELVRRKVDIIVTVVTQASLEAKKVTTTIPIVMVGVSDPVASGLVENLGRPGANITGTSAMTAEIVGKQLELLKEILPNLSRVAALWNPANPVFQGLQLAEAKAAAQGLGLQLQVLEARTVEDINHAFATAVKSRSRALLILGDPLFVSHGKRIADFATRGRLPSVSGVREHAEGGILLSYGPSYPDMYRRSAYYVDKIFKGAKPAELPVEQPTKFELVINLKAAKQIGLIVPPSVLAQADRLIR